MDIHEYQAKELLAKFGVPVPRGGLAYSPEQAVYRAHEISGARCVVKAQIHSGARGKAGGIKVCKSDDEIEAAAEGLLGKKLVTIQTGSAGKLVSRLYVEEAKPFCSVGAMVACLIQEKAFDYLDAPVLRVNSIDAPAIYSPAVEKLQLPTVDSIYQGALKVLK